MLPPNRTTLPAMQNSASQVFIEADEGFTRERVTPLDADFAFRQPIERFGMMDFPRLDQIVETGFEHAHRVARVGRLYAQLGAPSLPHPQGP